MSAKSPAPYRPEGYHSVTPSLTIKGAAQALALYQSAFGAEILMRLDGPNGIVVHAEMQIGDSRVMLSDEMPEWGSLSPSSIGGTASSLMIYVEDVDAALARAAKAGAEITMPADDQFWGDRMGAIQDPFGHRWSFATHIEDVSEEEIARRAQAWMATLPVRGDK